MITSFFFKIYFMFNYVYVCISIYGYVQVLQRPEEGVRSPGAGATSSGEPPNMGTVN